MAAEKAKDPKAKESKDPKAAKAKGPDPDDDTDERGEATAETETAPGRRFPGKKLVLMIGLPVALLIGGGIGAWQFGLIDKLFGGGHEANGESGAHKTLVFYELPEMLVNLNRSEERRVGKECRL